MKTNKSISIRIKNKMKKIIFTTLLLSCIAAPAVSEAAIVQFSGAEAGSSDFRQISGTASVSSAQAHSGTYSFRTNPTTTGTGSVNSGRIANAGLLTASVGTATSTVSFYFRYATKP